MKLKGEKNLSKAQRLDHWIKQKGRWQRRETIARNKIEQIDWRLEQLMDEAIRETDNAYSKRKISK